MANAILYKAMGFLSINAIYKEHVRLVLWNDDWVYVTKNNDHGPGDCKGYLSYQSIPCVQK